MSETRESPAAPVQTRLRRFQEQEAFAVFHGPTSIPLAMKTLHTIARCFPLPVALALSAAEGAMDTVGGQASVLWYDKPAARWEEAVPVGNGRLGAMIFGQPENERLQLNEGTLWAGGPYDPVNPEAKEALPQVRQLVSEAKYREAAKLISAKVMAKPLAQMPYQTVGDLLLTFPGMTNTQDYRRDLDLDTAMASVSFTSGGVRYTREVFASAPDRVIVVRLTADQPGKLSFVAGMKTPMKATVETEGPDTLVMRGAGGGAAGIAEMLMQSRLGRVSASSVTPTSKPEIELLPALPKAWPTGRVSGLRARGGFEVDVAWRGGKLVDATVRSFKDGPTTLRYGSTSREVTLGKGESYRWNGL